MPGLPLLTQEYRGYKKHWLQLPSGERLPYRGDVPDEPTLERLQSQAAFLEGWPALPEMAMPRITPDTAALLWRVNLGQEERPPYCPSAAHTDRQTCKVCQWIGFMDVRNLLRDVLASTQDHDATILGALVAGPNLSPTDLSAGVTMLRRNILDGIHSFCARDDPFPFPTTPALPATLPTPAHRDLTYVSLEEFITFGPRLNVWRWRAPLRSQLDADFKTVWCADTFPGVVWAELLNVFPLDAATSAALHRCKWCGRFWVDAEAPGRGPTPEFCEPQCRVRYHDFGSADRA